MVNLFTKEELLSFNEKMLGRGMPTQEDGIGYNKADYSVCASYFNGLSNAQLADLSKRLIKYSNTQLKINKDVMKLTHKHYSNLAGFNDKNFGVSLNITDKGTMISFRYNQLFVDTIRRQPMRQWDKELKSWIVPNDKAIQTLEALKSIGADVDNAIQYVANYS